MTILWPSLMFMLPITTKNYFYDMISEKLTPFRQTTLIKCTDFNQTFDPTLDSSNHAHTRSTALSSLLGSEDLYDPWPCLQDTESDYTFYSCAHKVYSRIDMFLVDKSVQDANIGIMTWSDHAPICLKLFPTQRNKKGTTWRLNTSLISQSYYQKHIRDWEVFFIEYWLCYQTHYFMECPLGIY